MEYRLQFVQNDDESADINTIRLLRETFNMNFGLFSEEDANAIHRITSSKVPFTRTDISIAKLAFERAYDHRRTDWYEVREQVEKLKVAGASGVSDQTLDAYEEMYHQQVNALGDCYETVKAMEQIARQMQKGVRGLSLMDESLTAAEERARDGWTRLAQTAKETAPLMPPVKQDG